LGKADAAMERYLEKPARYADLINGYRFHGRQVLKPEDILERDSRLSGISYRRRMKWQKRKQSGHQKQRDTVRKVIFGAEVAIIALENQSMIHYAMPVRTMIEDALEYDKQLRAIQREHKSAQDLKKPSEFVGGFSVQDKILPVSTFVLYWGEEEWTGPCDLLDLIDLEGLPTEIRQMINGYPLHVLEVRKFTDIDCFQTDLRDVFGVIQSSSDVDALLRYTDRNKERLENLEEDAYDVIAAVTGNITLMEKKDEYRKGSDTMNLCKGMVEWAERERQAGLSAGRIEGHSEGRIEGLAEGRIEGLAEGRLEGLAEGRLEGLAEGRLEGLAEGRLESKIQIAQNAFSMGFDMKQVSILCNEDIEVAQEWFDSWSTGDRDSGN